jgi:hypothetical protein
MQADIELPIKTEYEGDDSQYDEEQDRTNGGVLPSRRKPRAAKNTAIMRKKCSQPEEKEREKSKRWQVRRDEEY